MVCWLTPSLKSGKSAAGGGDDARGRAAGVIVLPHLHSSLGENFSAGMTLTPAGYASLLEPSAPRLFSDERLFDVC